MFATHKLMGAGGAGGEAYFVSTLYEASGISLQGVAVDSADNIISCGITSVASGNKPIVIKQDKDGNVLWDRSIGGSGFSFGAFRSVAVDASDNIIAVGQYYDGSAYRVLVMKFNSSGSILWQKAYKGAYAYQQGLGVAVDSSGNIAVSAQVQDSTNYSDGCIWLLNSSGTLQWQRKLNATYEADPNGIAFDSSGNVYVVGGYWKNTGGYTSTFLMKYNSSGAYQWRTGLDVTGNTENRSYGVAVNSSGDIYVSGYMNGVYPDPRKINVTKYNSSGTLQWNRRSDTTGDDYTGYGIAVSSDGNIYVNGFYKSTQDVLFLKYNSSGSLQWTNRLYGSGADLGYRVGITSTDSPVFTGVVKLSSLDNGFTAKVYPDGSGTGAIGASLTYASLSMTDTTSAQTVITPAVTDASVSLTETTPSFSDQTFTATATVYSI